MPQPQPPSRRVAWASGLVAALLAILTIDGPGITVDEPLDVRPGRTYLSNLRAFGWGFFRPDVVEKTFRDNAEHPPLGRWLLGVASELGEPFEVMRRGADPVGLYVRSGRLAPALAFGLMVGLVAHFCTRRGGGVAGIAAAFALMAIPRAWSHAHLGALDAFVASTWTAALLGAIAASQSRQPLLGMATAGLLFGLAALTKIQGWLLTPLVGCWTIYSLGWRRGIAASILWGLVGTVLFFAAWPWLWYETGDRLVRYFATATQRAVIRTQYFGAVYDDRATPWHYPLFYFAATIPVGLLGLGAVGAFRGWRERRAEPLFLVATITSLLALFATVAPVYDGERLFLMAFPLWAILVGFGTAWIWGRWENRWVRGALLAFLVAQGYGTVATHPYGLSYYNLLAGGTRGAERLGLELTYWSDSVDDRLLGELARLVAPGEKVALVPTLAPSQGAVLTSRGLLARGVVIADQEGLPDADWVIVHRREAYWGENVRTLVRSMSPAATSEIRGTWLSGIWKVNPRGE
jgi:4-amino-4-deoxy-L-arabinose transferase-like glycosyltransferase